MFIGSMLIEKRAIIRGFVTVDQLTDENRMRGDGLVANELAFQVADGVAKERRTCRAFIPVARGEAVFPVNSVGARKANGNGFLIRGQKIDAEETTLNDTAMCDRILIDANQHSRRIITH